MTIYQCRNIEEEPLYDSSIFLDSRTQSKVEQFTQERKISAENLKKQSRESFRRERERKLWQ